MDSDFPLSNVKNNKPKAEFRKPVNDAANRKYRRHSPAAGSSEEDGSPKRDHTSRGNLKMRDYERRNGDRVDDKTSRRSRGGDCYRHSSRSYRSSHDDRPRQGKYADDDDRGHAKPPSRSTRESRGASHSDYRNDESDYNRSRDDCRDAGRYSRDRSDAADRKSKTGYDGRHGSRYDDRDRRARGKDVRDEKRDHRSSRDRKSDPTSYNEDSRGNQSDSSKREPGEVKDKNDELNQHEASEGEDFAVKRVKFNSGETDASEADERQTSAKNSGEHMVKATSEQATVNVPGTTVDAAKVAAMKAAELVNKNLSNTGFMTADQKKKLLWGSKKSNSTEESNHRWDTSMFSDPERQEKFHKLMSLRLPWYTVGFEGGSEGGVESSKQRRCREGSARFGEAIHSWPPKKRRPHCGVRSLGSYIRCSCPPSSTDTLSACFLFVCKNFGNL